MTPHINPGTDTTINPVVIDDSYRERNGSPQRCTHEQVCKEYREWYETAKEIDSICPYTMDCPHHHIHTSAPSQTGRLCDDRDIIEIENKLTDTERQLIMVQQRVDAEIKELQKLSKAKWDAAERTKNITFSYEGIGVDEAIALLQAGRK